MPATLSVGRVFVRVHNVVYERLLLEHPRIRCLNLDSDFCRAPMGVKRLVKNVALQITFRTFFSLAPTHHPHRK